MEQKQILLKLVHRVEDRTGSIMKRGVSSVVVAGVNVIKNGSAGQNARPNSLSGTYGA